MFCKSAVRILPMASGCIVLFVRLRIVVYTLANKSVALTDGSSSLLSFIKAEWIYSLKTDNFCTKRCLATESTQLLLVITSDRKCTHAHWRQREMAQYSSCRSALDRRWRRFLFLNKKIGVESLVAGFLRISTKLYRQIEAVIEFLASQGFWSDL